MPAKLAPRSSSAIFACSRLLLCAVEPFLQEYLDRSFYGLLIGTSQLFDPAIKIRANMSG
jgi:hypothetical protein